MAIYKYVKAPVKVQKPRRRRSSVSIMASFVLMIVGFGLLSWISWPILSFMAFTAPALAKTVSPVSNKISSVLGVNKTITDGVDYTNPNVWFPARPQDTHAYRQSPYTISIPKLKIHDAVVTIAGDDLNKSLIHYGGTPLPGQIGNAVIFGHSTLVQLFNPKDYKTIFATLPTLKQGDEFGVNFDGIVYKYVIFDMDITDPSDFSNLENRTDGSFVTLITCVPPGTYYKRLNIKAKLASL